MDALRYLFGPPGADGSPGAGPGSPDGPYGPAPPPSASPPVIVTGTGFGTPPLMQVVASQLDLVRVVQAVQLCARFYNSLVYRGQVKLQSGERTDRQFVLDPAASPLFPGGGLSVRANTPGTYGTFS